MIGNVDDIRNIKYYIDDDNPHTNVSIYYKYTYVYGWGKNKYGELGLANTNDTFTPTAIKSLQNHLVSQVCSGGKHTVIATRDGKVLVCGTDVLGLLGNENKKWKEQHRFQKLSSLDNEFIIQVECAEFHSLCLTRDGHIYAWGGNLSNKLGQINQAGTPTRINSLIKKKIIQISCGDHHSAALSSNHEIFSWGGGGVSYNRGQCGHGDLKDVEAPKRIEYFKNKKPIKVVCGGYHTIVLCEDQLLYGFGKGTYGQCGYGVSEDTPNPKLIKFSRKANVYEQENPQKLDISNVNTTILGLDESSIYKSPIQIADIKCGGEHTVILSTMGRVYTFGHGWTGQLGLGNSRNYDRPIIVKSLLNKKIIQIAAGWSHTLVLTDSGNLYVAGCGKYGELGLGDNENRKNFTLVKSASMLNIRKINSGGHHSWIIIDDVNPEREDFYDPSPLASPNFTPNNARSIENSPRNNKQNVSITMNNISKQNMKKANRSALNNNLKFNLELLTEKIEKINNKKTLQVVYTDLKKCHRFVRFFVYKTKNVTYKDLNYMLAEFFKLEKSIVLYRLQNDDDINLNEEGDEKTRMNMIFREIKSDFKMLDLNSSTRLSYTLTIVYDHEKNNKMAQLKKNIEELRVKNNILNSVKNKSICKYFLTLKLDEVVNVTEVDIKSSQVEQIMSSWILDFYHHFANFIENDLEQPRFMELRPNCFYL